MADFLATLAARSLGQLPSVMPRRASRFEGDVVSPLIDGRHDIKVVEEQRRASEPAVRRLASSEAPAVERDEEDVLGSAPELGESMDFREPGDFLSTSKLDERLIDEREVDEPEAVHQASGRPSPSDAPASRPDEQPIGSRVREVGNSVDAAPRVQPGSRDASSPVPERHRRVSQEASSPATEPRQAANLDLGEPAREEPPQRGDALRVPTAVIAPDRGEEPSPRVEPELSPRITVTIGRIEVKAPPPQASPPVGTKPRPQPPRMSLDDYLRRERGRR